MEKDIIIPQTHIKLPKNLVLMPGEHVICNHQDFYVSNKRLIKHKPSLLKTTTEDYHFHHFKGIQDDVRRPLLMIGLITGLFSLLLGFLSPFFFIIGAISLVLAFWFKKVDLIVLHMDGNHIRIPNIRSATGGHMAKTLRHQLYGK